MSAAAGNADSHRYLDEQLTFRTLYELMYRANGLLFARHIQGCAIEHGLPWGEHGYNVKTFMGESRQSREIPDIYMIIDLYWQDVLIGHITFHLVPNSIYPYSSNSRLHIKSQTSNRRTRRFRITSVPATGDLLFSLGSMVVQGYNIGDQLHPICECILAVLNKYFTNANPDPLSLKNALTSDYTNARLLSYIDTIARYNRRVRRGGQNGGANRDKPTRDELILLTSISPIRVYPTTRKRRKH